MAQQAAPSSATPIKATEQKQLVVLFACDCMDQVFQSLSRLDTRNKPVKWQALTSHSEEFIGALLPDEEDGLNTLVVADAKELSDLGKWYKHVSHMRKFGRLDLLLEIHQAMTLPELRALSKEVPWRHGSLHERSRPIVLDSGKQQQFVVFTSTQQHREAGLSAKTGSMAMSEEGAPLTSIETQSAPTPAKLFAVQLGNKQLHQVMQCMGKSGLDWVTYPSHALGMAHMVYRTMEDEELSDMLNHVSETPFFAAMRYDEFFSKEFQSCLMVMHCFPRGRNDELNARLWWLICYETQKHIPPQKFSLQVRARNRVKLVFSEASHCEEWQRDAMPELIVRGLKFIDDRMDQEIGEYGGLSDMDKSISSSCSEAQGEEPVIVYDVQP